MSIEESSMSAVSTVSPIPFELRGEFIPLDALLKATGLAPSGGIAKLRIANGEVRVDGRDERRKTCKIRAGQRVDIDAVVIEIVAAHSS